MMSIRSLADFNRSSLGGDGDWLTPPPSPLRHNRPGRHDERGMGTFNWPPARTSTWPYTGTFSWPRTEDLLLVPDGGGLGAGMRGIGPAGHRPGGLPDRARRYSAAGLVEWSRPAGRGCPADDDGAGRRR